MDEAACKDPRFFDLCNRLGIDAGLPIEMKLILVRERILDTDQANVRNGNGRKVSGEDLLALIVDDIKAHHPKLKGTNQLRRSWISQERQRGRVASLVHFQAGPRL